MDLVFDIETIANPNLPANLRSALLDNIDPDKRLVDPVKIEADIARKQQSILSKFALSPLTGKVIGFGYAVNNQPVESFFDLDNEPEVLRRLSHILGQCNYVYDRIVGFNNKSFDVPFVLARAAVNGVFFRKMQFSRWQQEQGVFDLALQLNGNESFGYISLQKWAMLFGVLDAPYESGGDIAQMIEEGRLSDVITKCKKDVDITRKLYQAVLPAIGDSERVKVLEPENVKDLIDGYVSPEDRKKAAEEAPPVKSTEQLFLESLDG